MTEAREDARPGAARGWWLGAQAAASARVRYSVAGIALVLLAAGLAFGSPGRPLSDGPNIVFILSDDQSYESMQNAPSPMPYLQSQLDDPSQHWIAFRNTFTNVSLCCPSRSTILSGKYAFHTGVEANADGGLFNDTATIATALHSVGYHTGLIGKYMNRYPFGKGPFVPPGWDVWDAKMHGDVTTVYFNYTLSENGRKVSYGVEPQDYMTDVLTQKAVDFIDDAPAGRPFFLYYAPTAPHAPFVPAPRHVGVFSTEKLFRPPSVGEDVSDKPQWVQDLPPVTPARQQLLDFQHRRANETILGVDDGVEAIMNALRAKGELDNTVIVYMSDNGYSFGEHNVTAKRCAYDECARVPFYIRMPSATAGSVRFPVSNTDITPTFAQLAGVAPPGPVDGASLLPLLRGQTPPDRPGVVVEWAGDEVIPPFWGYRTARSLYVEYPWTGEQEFYDLKIDPWALDNRAGDPEYRKEEERSQALLHARVPEWAFAQSAVGAPTEAAVDAAAARSRTHQ